MSYPRSLLTENEEVCLDVHPHWSALAPSGAVGAVMMLGLIEAGVAGWLHGVGGHVLLGLFALALLWVLWRGLVYLATNFVVTSVRIIYRHGVIGRQSQEIPLAQITNTRVTRGVIERILGNGTLIVESAGRDSTERFLDIAHTEKVHQLLAQLMEDQRTGRGDKAVGEDGEGRERTSRSSGEGVSDVAEQLERISALHGAGKLSDDEFLTAKKRILGS
jgi:uncharacterized membrane protein YdbT with pleckstrin-like domain